LKPSSKRKRTREELEEVKDEELDLKEDKQKFLQETKRLKQDKHDLEDRVVELKKYEDLVLQLQEGGQLDIRTFINQE